MNEQDVSTAVSFLTTHRLKADLHIHAGRQKESAKPQRYLAYSPRSAIDRAAALGLDAIAIANHDYVCYDGQLAEYARRRGLLLIPAMEATIEGYHVLIINAPKQLEGISTFRELEELNRDEVATVAPHPFYPARKCLRGKLREHLGLFDAVEFSSFYYSVADYYNRRAIDFAQRHGLSILGSSDAHHLDTIGRTFSVIASRKEPAAIVHAIKSGMVQVATTPYKATEFTKHLFRILFNLN